MCRTWEYASMTIVTWPGVSRNSIGYGWFIMPGKPGGRQLADSLSPAGVAASALAFAAYSGVREGCGRGARARGAAGAAPRPATRGGPPIMTSQTPVKSGSLARAVQSSAVGGLRVNFSAAMSGAAAKKAANNAGRTRRVHFITEQPLCKSVLSAIVSDSLPQPLAHGLGDGSRLFQGRHMAALGHDDDFGAFDRTSHHVVSGGRAPAIFASGQKQRGTADLREQRRGIGTGKQCVHLRFEHIRSLTLEHADYRFYQGDIRETGWSDHALDPLQ